MSSINPLFSSSMFGGAAQPKSSTQLNLFNFVLGDQGRALKTVGDRFSPFSIGGGFYRAAFNSAAFRSGANNIADIESMRARYITFVGDPKKAQDTLGGGTFSKHKDFTEMYIKELNDARDKAGEWPLSKDEETLMKNNIANALSLSQPQINSMRTGLEVLAKLEQQREQNTQSFMDWAVSFERPR